MRMHIERSADVPTAALNYHTASESTKRLWVDRLPCWNHPVGLLQIGEVQVSDYERIRVSVGWDEALPRGMIVCTPEAGRASCIIILGHADRGRSD
jgi:hypothetical protein